MPEPPLSPSQQVERIREILVGRQMQQVEERLERLERLLGSSEPGYPSPFPAPAATPDDAPLAEAQALQRKIDDANGGETDRVAALAAALAEIRGQLDAATTQLAQHEQLLHKDIRSSLEELNESTATRIDTRAREVVAHTQAELEALKKQLTHDFLRVDELKADRTEVAERFARIATAAMDDGALLGPKEGFLP